MRKLAKKHREKYRNEIVKLFKQGNKMTKIADILNINRLDVRIVLEENGLYVSNYLKLRDDYKAMVKNIKKYHMEDELSSTQISEKIGVSSTSVLKILKENNLEPWGQPHHVKKHSFNKQAFSTYTPESVYWAGFIAGDGCVFNRRENKDEGYAHVLTIGLSYKDREHLENFKGFMEFTGDLYINKDKTKIALTINSEELVKDLIEKYNITPLKTDTYEPPSNIPKNMVKYFILGLIDSDGGFVKVKRPNKPVIGHVNGEYVFNINFTGTMATVNYVKKFFDSSVKLTKRHDNNSNNFTVLFQGNRQVIRYGSMIYDKNSKEFCMKRKYSIYCELLEQYNIVVHDGNIMDYELVNL